MDPGIIVGVIGGTFGFASTVYVARAARLARREQAEIDTRMARLTAEDGAYKRAEAFDVGLQARMNAEITRQRGEIDQQAGQIRALQRQVAYLTRQVTDAGLTPVTVPEEDPYDRDHRP